MTENHWWLGGWCRDLDKMPSGLVEVAFDSGLGTCNIHVCARHIESPTLINGFPVPKKDWRYAYTDSEGKPLNTHGRRAYAWRPIPVPLPPSEYCPKPEELDAYAERCLAMYGMEPVREWVARKLGTPDPSVAVLREALEAMVGGQCPDCKGWGEIAHFGEVVRCRCNGAYRHVPTDAQITTARAALSSTNPTLSHGERA